MLLGVDVLDASETTVTLRDKSQVDSNVIVQQANSGAADSIGGVAVGSEGNRGAAGGNIVLPADLIVWTAGAFWVHDFDRRDVGIYINIDRNRTSSDVTSGAIINRKNRRGRQPPRQARAAGARAGRTGAGPDRQGPAGQGRGGPERVCGGG